MNYVIYPNKKILAYYAIIAPLIGSSLLILVMLLVEYIFKPHYTTDILIALLLIGAVYLFGSILSLPSAILTGICFILISARFSRLPTIIFTSLVGCVTSGVIISLMFGSRIEQFILFATVGLFSTAIITIWLTRNKKP
jgi:hypothetical protein